MNPISILIDEHSARKIRGSVTWSAQPAPARVEVRLFWFTTGGAQQIGLVAKNVISSPLAEDTQRFEFPAPNSPRSFEGNIAALHWALEAILFPTRACARIFIKIPADQVLLLHRAERTHAATL